MYIILLWQLTTVLPSPPPTPTPTQAIGSPAPTVTPTILLTPTPTEVPTLIPTATPTPEVSIPITPIIATPSATPTPVVEATPSATVEATPIPSLSDTPTPTLGPNVVGGAEINSGGGGSNPMTKVVEQISDAVAVGQEVQEVVRDAIIPPIDYFKNYKFADFYSRRQMPRQVANILMGGSLGAILFGWLLMRQKSGL
jgi:hypothetical protein